MRMVTHGRRAAGRVPIVRMMPIAVRNALRRVAARIAVRAGSIRVRMSLPLRSDFVNTAADRIAVCSLEKKTFPAAVSL
jgi:hypothetical protein